MILVVLHSASIMPSKLALLLLFSTAVILSRVKIEKKPFIWHLLSTLLGVQSANQGSVRVCNRGGYVANCGLESRTADGRSRSYETGHFLAGQCSTLELPYEAVWGRVWCNNYVFIATTKRVFQEEFGTPAVRCYDIGGTTFHPSWGRTGC